MPRRKSRLRQTQKVGGEPEEGVKGVRETLGDAAVDKNRVNISVSHASLTTHMRLLTGVRTAIRFQAQEVGPGPRKVNGKAFRDVTNRLEIRPTIAKQSRPGSWGIGEHSAGSVRILKRPPKGWGGKEVGGPPFKSPFEGPLTARKPQADGSGQNRPPDPPDENKNMSESPNPSGRTQAAELG